MSVPASKPRAEKLLMGLGAATLALAGVFTLGELGVRLLPLRIFSTAAIDPLALEQRNWRVQPHPYLAYANKPGFENSGDPKRIIDIRHNSLGFHGPETTWEKPPGTFRIYCMGGSSTYGQTESSTEKTWPWRLQEFLQAASPERKIEVINAGCQGYSTFEGLINLELRGVEFRPDLVLVYHAINDMRCALTRNPVPDNTHFRVNWPVERGDGVERLFERSRLYRVLRRWGTDWYQRRSNLGAYAIRDYMLLEDPYIATEERGFQNFRRNLVSIVAVARAHGAQVAFATEAMWLPHIEAARGYQAQKRGLERIRELTLEVGRELDVPVIDSAPVVEGAAHKQQEATGAQTLIKHEVHFTDAGSELLAHILAKELRERGLVPRGGS
jgi:lysophospholipase L1-like esterase